MKVQAFTRSDWLDKFAKDAYSTVFERNFDEVKKSLFDAAILVVDDNECPISFATYKQLTEDSVYLEHGGSFPDYRNKPEVKPSFQEMLKFLQLIGAKQITLSTRNENVPMQRLALSSGFIPTGMHMIPDGLFIQYELNFTEEK